MLHKYKRNLTRQAQMSESFILSAVLAFSGGFQDAYTYIVRGGVFANAQTGNIVLMSTHFLQGHWMDGLRYLLPVAAFILGVALAAFVLQHFKNARVLHWRQIVLLLEVVILAGVGFLPRDVDLIANVLVSLSCAMQVQAFRTIGGNVYASTMCIGNLRSGTSALASYLHLRDVKYLDRALHYFGVIALFALGAGVGGVLSQALGQHTIWLTGAPLALAFVLMEFDREENG